MTNKQVVLALGAHPDDIEIGMGGTVAKLVGMGYDVKLVVATLPNFVKTDTKEERKKESTMSAKVMGCKTPEFLDLGPEEITFNQDHQALTKAVIAAARDSNNVFMYETTIPGGISETAFRPQLYVDVTETLDSKRNALDCFDSQKIRCGHLWVDAIVGRCSYRGYQMNTKYAEAFEVIRVSKW